MATSIPETEASTHATGFFNVKTYSGRKVTGIATKHSSTMKPSTEKQDPGPCYDNLRPVLLFPNY